MPISANPRPTSRKVRLKSWLPTSLFSRALLILLVPVVVMQLLVAHIFYDRHWSSVVRNMSGTTVADIVMLVDEYEALSLKLGTREALNQTVARGNLLDIKVNYRPIPELRLTHSEGRRYFPDFYDNLGTRMARPIKVMKPDEDSIRVRVNTIHGVLEFEFSRKRLASATTWIFIVWMVGSGILLTTIATLFLRNQVKPIVALAKAAEQFGLGHEVTNFSPRGANEVRRAGRAFVMMAERTRRHLQNRTEMLAGISHDLRTPLTRMKLELEMGTIDPNTRAALATEIDEMRMMIDEYLDFARGDTGEVAEPIDSVELVNDIVAQYQRSKQEVTFAPQYASVVLMLRPQAIRRALTNLIDNALRYGDGKADITLEQSATFVRIKITDHGNGIPEMMQEEVFKPFTRLDPSRNQETGGVGLGLSIVRSIAQAHGGEVSLENQRNAAGEIIGMEATLRLPREMHTYNV